MSEEKNAPQTETTDTNEMANATTADNAIQSDVPEKSPVDRDMTEQEENIPAKASIQDISAVAASAAKETAPEAGTASEEETIDAAAQVSASAGGFWSALFNGFAKGGPLILLLALACVSWHDFINPDNAVYCPPEFPTLTAFLHSIAQGNWLTPIGLENNAWSNAIWPGFLWFVGILALIPGLGASSLLLPVAEIAAGAIAIVAIWWLSHACKFGSKAAFAAGAMALCCPLFAPLPHFMGPAALAAGLLLLALLFFYKGWSKDFSILTLPLAFILTAFAGLTGGFLHFATPLVASICFLAWQGSLKRAQRLDALLGFILMLIVIGAWLGIVMLHGENDAYLSMLFADSANLTWPPAPHWWFALAAGFLGSLPWLLTIFGVSWMRVLGKSGESIKNSRHSNGSAIIWTSLVIAAAIAVWIPQFHASAVAICSILLVLLGKAFIRMPPAGNRLFFFLAALVTTIVGLALLAMHFEFSQDFILSRIPFQVPDIARNALLETPAFAVVAAILALGGLIGFYFVKRFCHAGGLVYALFIAILLCQPCRLWLVPELSKNNQLPVRTYSALLAEVEKASSNTGSLPAPTGIAPEPGLPASPPDRTEAIDSQPEAQQNGSPVSPANPDTQQPGEEIIIIEKTPGETTAPAVPPNLKDLPALLEQQRNAASLPENSAESAPQAAPGESGANGDGQILAPAPVKGPNGEPLAAPESANPQTKLPDQTETPTLEEIIIEKTAPMQPDTQNNATPLAPSQNAN